MQLRSQAVWKWAAVLILVFVVGALAACGASGDNPGSEAQVMSGQALLETRCIQCHSLDTVTNTTKTPDGWHENVENMVLRGARLNEQEIEVLVAYLAAEYGR